MNVSELFDFSDELVTRFPIFPSKFSFILFDLLKGNEETVDEFEFDVNNDEEEDDE